MKQGKRPTRNQKKLMLAVGLSPEKWLIYKKINSELHLVHRETGTTKIIPEQ
ncbi:putative NHN endonuclease [Bacillus phage vB_Bacillus_1020A]|jgi:hypothetical protein|nr:putative NHN endonuclease [Bacillus phage vB_Bacillus_1020A]